MPSLSPLSPLLRLYLALSLFFCLFHPAVSHPCVGISSYIVSFIYNWNTGNDASFPVSDNSIEPGFSPLVCASHNPDYTLWQPDALISLGVRTLLTNVSNEGIENELEQAQLQKKVLQYLTVSTENVSATGTTFLAISVDALGNFTRLSCIAKIIPSPDWFIGLPSIDLCTNGSFTREREGNLFGWDGGIDNSEAYDESVPQPTSEAVPVLRAQLASPGGYGRAIVKQTQLPKPSPTTPVAANTDNNSAPTPTQVPNPFVPEEVSEQSFFEPEPDTKICVDADALEHLPPNALLYTEHRLARVLCDPFASCATPGHMVSFRGVPMMMMSYCRITRCTKQQMFVNSPRYKPAIRIPTRSPHLQFTALAARYSTPFEEYIMSTALRIGL
ncbi:unnamed protein product [Agarophyton chilense]